MKQVVVIRKLYTNESVTKINNSTYATRQSNDPHKNAFLSIQDRTTLQVTIYLYCTMTFAQINIFQFLLYSSTHEIIYAILVIQF